MLWSIIETIATVQPQNNLGYVYWFCILKVLLINASNLKLCRRPILAKYRIKENASSAAFRNHGNHRLFPSNASSEGQLDWSLGDV